MPRTAFSRREQDVERSGLVSPDQCFFVVMAGQSRPKDGVASARLCPAIHVFSLVAEAKGVDARHKAGHDDVRSAIGRHGKRRLKKTPRLRSIKLSRL
jgi:hypothetical protein